MTEKNETPHYNNEAATALDPDIVARVESLMQLRKKITINDVAFVAGLSKKTVSRIINNYPAVREETRTMVNEVIRLTNFRPDPQARGLAFRRSFLLGLIYENPNAQYVVNMQQGILDCLRGTDFELVVHPCERRTMNFLSDITDFVERQSLAGVIILPPIAEDQSLLSLLSELDVPFIRVTARKGALNHPVIDTAEIVSLDQVGCRQAGIYIAQQGHKRIGFIGGDLIYPSAHERRLGFEAGLMEYGISIDPAFDLPGDYSFGAGYRCAMTMLKDPNRPTAIIGCNDEMAAGIYKAAYELGLEIPRDVSVIGFDNSPLASRLSPGLSSVGLPHKQMAYSAASFLLSNLKGEKSRHFPSSLTIRQSVCPPKS